MLNRSEPNVILTAHATKVNRPEPNWTEPQTCLAGQNHALSRIFTLQNNNTFPYVASRNLSVALSWNKKTERKQ